MARVLVGDRDAWRPIHLDVARGGDGLPHPIFTRPAVRSYDVGGPFDAWRAAADERVSSFVEAVHAALKRRLGALRAPLDVRGVRAVYRVLRAAYRECCWAMWDVLFDGGDYDWPIGLAVCAALALFVYVSLAL